MSGRILIIDDDKSVCELLEAGLSKKGFAVSSRTSGDEALDILANEAFDAIVTDLNMKGLNGLEICERVAQNRPDLPVIVITAFGSLDTAIAAIRAGAYDFITKPFELETLRMTLDRAIRHKSLRDEVKRLRHEVEEQRGFEEIVGTSPAMRRVYDLLDRVSDSSATVLVTGESGTGKELVARAIHKRSARREGPFVAVNCAALPEALLESELFGHAKGAFTDARGARTGLFVAAGGGTLLLDEIGEMPLGLQPKLLRALQERSVRPVGSDTEVPIDVRIIATTNRDLETAVEEKAFREDLYYRINVIHVVIPPLRSRGNDVLLLAQHFITHFAASMGKNVKGISPAAADKLLSYAWPGNVRGLQNCVERAVALARYEEIQVEDLPEKIRNYTRRHVVVASDDPAELITMDEVERRYILRVLEAANGNKTLAARVLGFDRATLYRKLERYGASAGPSTSGTATGSGPPSGLASATKPAVRTTDTSVPPASQGATSQDTSISADDNASTAPAGTGPVER